MNGNPRAEAVAVMAAVTMVMKSTPVKVIRLLHMSETASVVISS